MSKYLKPRTIYLAALGLAALITVDLVRKMRSGDLHVPESVTGTIESVSERVTTTAERITEAVRPTPTREATIDEELEIVEVEREEQLPVEVEPQAELPVERTPDDLTQIKGIGPTYARRLQAVGIKTYADVANADPEYLQEITRATGAQADPQEWIDQAKLMV